MFVLELSSIKELNSCIIDFFCKKDMREFSWKKKLADQDLQAELILKTVDSDIIEKYQIDIVYQRRFMRKLMSYLETIGACIADEVYHSYCRLSTGIEYKFYYVYYPIFENNELESLTEVNAVILKESVNIISQGTTGLVTWQASQALAEWALKTNFENKTILELGSGTGMAGLVVASSTSCKKYIFTDGHSDVLSLLTENVKLNSDNTLEKVDPEKDMLFSGSVKNCKVEVRKIDWETFDEDSCKDVGPVDIIFTADCVYDKDLFPPLLKTIKMFLENGTTKAVIAFTRRNEHTVGLFDQQLESMNFSVKYLDTLEPNYISWEYLPIIFLIEVSLPTDV